MLKKLTHFYHPKTVKEACKMLSKSKGEIVAGGTSEALKRNNSIETLIDIGRISEIEGITKDSDYYYIGAATKIQDIYKSTELDGPSGVVLKEAAGKIGSTLLRNCITIGGNLVALFPWSDLPPVLMTLDAEVVISGPRSERTVKVNEIVEKGPKSYLKPTDLITSIKIPRLEKKAGTSFCKFSKTANDYALITVATNISIKRNMIENVAIAVNAITTKPVRCKNAENILQGKKPDSSLIKKAASEILKDVKVRKDFRAGEKYRKEVLTVLVERSLCEAISTASGKEI